MCDPDALIYRTHQNWPMSLEARKTHLKSILEFVSEKEEKIVAALREDLGRVRVAINFQFF